MKVLVPEDDRDVVLGLISEADHVATSRLSYVECHSALYRAGRDGRIAARRLPTAARRFAERWMALIVVELDDPLGRTAVRLCRDHALRGADAIHLASALAVAPAAGDVTFACFDRRLWEAAGALGFERVPASAP